MLLTLNTIFAYAKCTISSRNLIEGEQVLNSNQVILCGKLQIENDRSNITIKSLVIQSSKVSDMPHEITGKLHIQAGLIHILNFLCTCKAGASECCKHVVAVLLHLNRNPIEDIQSLSSTDIKCQWSKLKEPSLNQYKPVPIRMNLFWFVQILL
uniref:SWIM-type domain-containing protein n=1 Tax=Schizaphis graminum TaxID=13262 RepID=A0A2S2NLW6_SCHGA